MDDDSIYQRFHLLPPPPPTPLSFDRSGARMRLPNFHNVSEAGAYLDKMLIYRHNPAMTATLLVVLCLGIVLLLATLVTRTTLLVQRKLWLFRIVRTPEGRILMPAINSVFHAVGNCFSVLSISCGILQFTHYYRRNSPLPHYPLWLMLQFCPLWAAFFFQTWASTFGRVPGSRRYEIKLQPRESHRHLRNSPLLVNILWLSGPVIVTTLIAIPAAICDHRYELLRLERDSWHRRYDQAPQLSEEMLIQLQVIWQNGIQVVMPFAIGFILWFIFTIIATIIYAVFSFRLILQLHRHLSALLHLQQLHQVTASVRVSHSTFVLVSATDHILKTTGSAHREPMEHPDTFSDIGHDELQEHLSSSSVFPAIDARHAFHEPLGDGQAFRRVLLFFGVQIIIFTGAALAFAVVSLWLALSIVDSAEQNDVGSMQGAAYLSASLMAVGLGVILNFFDRTLKRTTAFQALMHGEFSDESGDGTTARPKPNGKPAATADSVDARSEFREEMLDWEHKSC